MSGERILEGVEDYFKFKETQTFLLAKKKGLKEREQTDIPK